MRYTIRWRKRALSEFRKLDKMAQQKIEKQIERLQDNPRPVDSKALKGEWKGCMAVRAGLHYRVIYSIEDDELVVWIIRTDKRSDAY